LYYNFLRTILRTESCFSSLYFFGKVPKTILQESRPKKFIPFKGGMSAPSRKAGRPPLALRKFFLTAFVSMQNRFEKYY
jgi:hypothetical protein